MLILLQQALDQYFDSSPSVSQETQQELINLQNHKTQQQNTPKSKSTSVIDEKEEIAFLRSCCEIVNKKDSLPLPLQGMKISAVIVDFAAEVTVAQRFLNPFENPIEAVFTFQHDQSTIFEISFEIDGKLKKGVCQTTQKAKDTYDDAIAQGSHAVLVERGDRDDSFQVNIGNLPAGKDCIVHLKYACELLVEEKAAEFILPLTKTFVESKEDDRNKLVGYQVSMDITSSSLIASLTSRNHPMEYHIHGKKATVSMSENTNVGYPVNLSINFEDSSQPQARLEAEVVGQVLDGQSNEQTEDALMISFVPKIESEEDVICEVVFIVDRSGSMSGSRMEQAKNALQLFLRSLPLNTKFNIVSFGSRYEKMESVRSVSLNEDSLKKATSYVSNLKADLGGTQILPPLTDVLGQTSISGVPRIIFFLTDGEVDNTSEVLKYISRNIGSSRIFPFGVGAEASVSLVTGMARFGKGKPAFVRSGERIETAVMKQMKRAMMPMVTQMKIDCASLPIVKSFGEKEYHPLFDGHVATYYFLLKHEERVKMVRQGIKYVPITPSGFAGQKMFSWKVDVNLEESVSGGFLHRLAAKELISDLKRDNNTQDAIKYALKYGLITKETSFVAVEQGQQAVLQDMQLVNIDAHIQTLHRAAASMGEELQEQNFRYNEFAISSSKSKKKSGGIGFNLSGLMPSMPSLGSIFGKKESVDSSVFTSTSPVKRESQATPFKSDVEEEEGEEEEAGYSVFSKDGDDIKLRETTKEKDQEKRSESEVNNDNRKRSSSAQGRKSLQQPDQRKEK
eukprot:TRINITY_DN3329_c0_g1_i1.p1 TRINITY_DN3329_c0_g1~~TRINITY_DN3329_c0_g1_i1.p1  ORF type:complete len:792 (-),score=164.49 TRINITY_DN3329_c0_g1_i1:28-2403(-)